MTQGARTSLDPCQYDLFSVFIDFSQKGKNSELKVTKSKSSILGEPFNVIKAIAIAVGCVPRSFRVLPTRFGQNYNNNCT